MQFACELLIYTVIILIVRIAGNKVMKKTNDTLFSVYRSTEEWIIVIKENGNHISQIHKHQGVNYDNVLRY